MQIIRACFFKIVNILSIYIYFSWTGYVITVKPDLGAYFLIGLFTHVFNFLFYVSSYKIITE
jgi:hypothetical protein